VRPPSQTARPVLVGDARVEAVEDAYRRGVLRQAGAVYQFRHIRLQHHLAHAYRHRGRPAMPRRR
jgi:hypothetical protein